MLECQVVGCKKDAIIVLSIPFFVANQALAVNIYVCEGHAKGKEDCIKE